jgi:hypothetical protein
VVAIEAIGWRDADEHECRAANDAGCAENCYRALDTTENETYTIVKEGSPVGMFGVVPINEVGVPPGHGIVWLLASPLLYEIKLDFLRQCSGWLDHLQRFYPWVHNYVHAENQAAMRWCKYTGFHISPADPYGVRGESFHFISRSVTP